jgi:RNA polymerase sigma-70 factor (ECF subfamily)
MITITDFAPLANELSCDTAVDRAIIALWPTAYRIAWLILRDHMAAEDVAQESCIHAIRSRQQLRDDSALSAWFRSIVTRLALSALRCTIRARRHEEPAAQQRELATPFDPSTAHDLLIAIERLSDELRIPLILAYYNGYTSREIAKRLGLAPATIRYRLAVARNAIRPLLEISNS